MLCLLRTSRHHQAPSRLELLQKCRRDPLGRGRHQDLVKGRVLGPATGPVPDADADVRVSKPPQADLPGPGGELLDNLHAPHPGRKLGQDGRLIAQAGADLEHRLVRLRGQKIGHERHNEGL